MINIKKNVWNFWGLLKAKGCDLLVKRSHDLLNIRGQRQIWRWSSGRTPYFIFLICILPYFVQPSSRLCPMGIRDQLTALMKQHTWLCFGGHPNGPRGSKLWTHLARELGVELQSSLHITGHSFFTQKVPIFPLTLSLYKIEFCRVLFALFKRVEFSHGNYRDR